MRWLKSSAGILRDAAGRWLSDDVPQLGAALAYYSLFSIAPLLVIAVAIAGIAFDSASVRSQLQLELAGAIGADAATAILGLVDAAAGPRKGFWAAAIGVVMLIVGAVSLFIQVRTALGRIWKAPASPRESGILRTMRSYALAVLLVGGVGALLIGALAVSSFVAALDGLGNLVPGQGLLIRGLEMAVSAAMTTLVFALVFRIGSKFAWKDVWFGAVATALLYALGKTLFGFYIETSGVKSGYGAAGALVVFLVWIYYTAQIFLFGAEIVAATAEAKRAAVSSPDASGAYSRRS
ncbi:MAG: YihY/virulence factor BrkB family protein [Alphaproteobacteria bacterium]